MNGVITKKAASVKVLGMLAVMQMVLSGCVDNLYSDMAATAATSFASVIGDALGQLVTGLLQ
jgi:hypothetical protein